MNNSVHQLLFAKRRVAWASVLLGLASVAMVNAAIPQKMQAVRTDSAGAAGALKLETVDVPSPREGQVLIQAYAAGTNPSDWNVRTGAPGGAGGPPAGAPGGAAVGGLPAGGPPGAAGGMGGGMMNRNPGNDVAGVVVAVGAGVTAFKVGDAVISALQESGGGAYAEYVAANVDRTVLKPKSFTYQQAAGIPTAGFTGLRMVILGNVKKGERVLVIGAAGGVGSTAVQAAKARGATVVSSASARHAAYLKSIGVDEVISYDKETVADKAKNIDVVIVTVGSENANGVSYAKRGGRVVTIAGQADAATCTAAGLTCINGGPGSGPSIGELLTELVQMADAGKLTVKVDNVFPLAEINAAHALGRAGSREGKIIIAINKDSTRK